MQHTIHDAHSHAADAFRYVAMARDFWENKIYGKALEYVNIDYDIYK
jgi:hypothetical protein